MKKHLFHPKFWVTLIIVAAIVLVIYEFSTGTWSLAQVQKGLTPAQQITLTNCGQNPTLAVQGTDSLQASQNVSPSSYNYRVNGVYVGTSYTPVLDDKVDFLASSDTYLTNEGQATMKCGTNNVPLQFYHYGNVTASIYTDAGTAVLTNGVASTATNETALTAGSSKNNKIHLVGTALRSTGKLFMYVEFPVASKANISTVAFSGLPQVTIPSGISSTGTNPYMVAFEIPALNNGEVRDYNLQYTTTSTGTLKGAMRIMFYAEQPFADTDGTFKTGIYDSLNNKKWKDQVPYNFVIGDNL